jgi:hypothetical protein
MTTESVGSLINSMYRVREKIRKLSSEEKTLKEKYTNLEQRLIAVLDTQKSLEGKTKYATATIKESTLPSVEDWDEFFKFLRRTNNLHMLYRRVNPSAFREYVDNSRGHKLPPGTATYVKREISLRNRPLGE